ncbi:MAG: RHS repeat-associated core domain-containing protein [bacterium]
MEYDYFTASPLAEYIHANDQLVSKDLVMGGLFTAFFHHDGLGSIRDITDKGGNVLTSYDYDAFGEVKQGYIGKYNYNSFTGKQYDPESKLYYFGARYYDPKIGRFITKDPYTGNVYFPPNLHKYIYCYNDPINWIDLWGLCPISPEDEVIIEDWLAEFGLGFLALLFPKEFLSSLLGLAQQAESPKYPQQDRSIGEKWKDFQQNPDDWEKIGEKFDPSQPKDGDSSRELWRNKKTGEEIGIHKKTPTGTNKKGKPKHPHPFPHEKHFP